MCALTGKAFKGFVSQTKRNTTAAAGEGEERERENQLFCPVLTLKHRQV